MEIQKTTQVGRHQATKGQSEKDNNSFPEVLSGTLASKRPAPDRQQKSGNLLEIGTITKQTPTVSDLLHQHEEFKGATWEILANNQNQDKNYRAIPPGTKIHLNRESGELSWAGTDKKQITTQLQEASTVSQDTSQTLRQGGSGLVASETSHPEKGESVRLGIINNDTPTVSHLLLQDSRFHDQTWDILGQTVNAEKPFHRMQIGMEVLLNPSTKEISWRSKKSSSLVTIQAGTIKKKEEPTKEEARITLAPATDLSQAVQPYLGKSYKEINCYELLVNGLKQLDIPYKGRNGLQSRLTRMALDRGMAANAYLNGEGIVEAAGSTVLSKNYSELVDWQKNAADLIKEIEPLLNNGQILSFSTQTKGHTGIVSRQDERWTFINSGKLDNPIGEPDLKRGVGEEVLDKEIRNWFKLAHKSGEALLVTLGELNQEKIRTAANIGELQDNRI